MQRKKTYTGPIKSEKSLSLFMARAEKVVS